MEASPWEGRGQRVSHGICQTPPGGHHPRNDSLSGNIFKSSATQSERRKAQLPPGLRPGQFCAHGETVGKSSLPQVQSQPCPFPDSQGAEILVLPSALRPHPGFPGAPSLGGAGAPRVTFSFSDLCLPSSPPPPPPSPGNC